MSERADKIELVLGRDWRDDVRYLSELRPYRPADSTLNLVEICDIIDLVVDGMNLTASITEESVFGFVAQLMEGLWSMAIGRNHKAIVEFHCEPWELCVAAAGPAVLVSLYSVDRRQRVVAHDVEVDAAAFIASAVRAAEELLADLFAISESFATDPFVRRFSNVLGKLRRVHAVRFPEPAVSMPEQLVMSSTTSGDGVTMSYTLDVAYGALKAYGGEQAFDQHALLVPGSLRFETATDDVVVCEGYPVLAVRAILDRVRELLTFLESSTSRFICDSELHQLRLDVDAAGTAWRVHVGPDRRADAVTFTTRPNTLLDGLLTVAEMIVTHLAGANEHLQLNQRFMDLREEIRELRSWHADFADANHYLEHPEQFLVEHGDLRPVEAVTEQPSFPWPLGDVRALYPMRAWEFRAAKINFSFIASTDDVLFIPTQDELVTVERASGEVRWRRSSAGTDALTSYALAGDVVVAADDAKQLHLIDLDTGEKRTSTSPQLGSLIVSAAAYQDGEIVVVGDFHGGLIGLDPTGSELWRFETNHGLLSGMGCAGPVVCVMSSPGFVHGVNPANGKLLWKVRLGGLADAGPFFHQGRVYTFSHDPRTRQLTVHAMFPYTGRTAWQLRFEGWLAGRPDFIGDYVIVPIERHGRVALIAVNVEAPQPGENWRLDVLSAGVDHPTRVTPVDIDGEAHGLVRTDTGETTCFKVEDGTIRWRIEHARPSDLLFRNLDLVVVRDAVLCVGERLQLRNLSDGTVLHEFGEVMVAPEYVSVARDLKIVLGERGADHGDDDSLVAWSTQHFLAVVE